MDYNINIVESSRLPSIYSNVANHSRLGYVGKILEFENENGRLVLVDTHGKSNERKPGHTIFYTGHRTYYHILWGPEGCEFGNMSVKSQLTKSNKPRTKNSAVFHFNKMVQSLNEGVKIKKND